MKFNVGFYFCICSELDLEQHFSEIQKSVKDPAISSPDLIIVWVDSSDSTKLMFGFEIRVDDR